MTNLFDWAQKHKIGQDAMLDLLRVLDPPSTGIDSGKAGTEAAVQADIRVQAARLGCALWRNNSGSLQDATGRWVRFGVGNDSKRINEVWKSPDLVGINPVRIGLEHVGSVIGQFWGVEVKEPGWKFNPKDAHQVAQQNCLRTINGLGGRGQFAQNVKDLWNEA
jgi:hypothetical protein